MAPNTRNMEQWTINDYVQYLSGSTRLGGNSESFEKIKSLAQELQQIDSQVISYDMVQSRTSKLEELLGETFEYANTHANPWTSTGKERKQVMESFMRFCADEKRLTDFSANVKYFENQSLDSMKQGVGLNQLHNHHIFMDRIKQGPMTEEAVLEYTNSMSQYIQASEVYLFHHPNHGNITIGEDGETIQERLDAYKKCIDSMRDLRTVRGLIAEGKNWDDLLNLREATAEITEIEEILGANVSQRIMMTYNGKKGFFTERVTAKTIDEIYDEAIDSAKNPEHKALLEANKDFILKHAPSIGENRLAFFSSKAYIFVEVCRAWDRMENSQEKTEIQQLLKCEGIESALESVVKDYHKKLSAKQGLQLSADEKKAFFEAAVKERKMPENVASLMLRRSMELSGITEQINPSVEPRPSLMQYVKMDQKVFQSMLGADISTEAGRKEFEARRALVRNGALRTEVMGIVRDGKGFEAALGDAGKLKSGSELTGRNVASSRIAELLGVGNLFAHSEKMTVKMPDGRMVDGCFMEFAEGVDLRRGDDLAVREASRIKLTRNAGFMKDACNIEILDYICAQGDRHGGNMFVKLGEPKADGTKEIIGIQGIDNDLAFTSNPNPNSKQDTLENLHLIDKALAEKIMAVDRSKLEAVVGDILSPKEMDALYDRFEKAKSNIRQNMILLEGDQWNLDADPKEFGPKADLYIKALQDNEKALSAKYDWQYTHKNAFIRDELNAGKAKYDKETQILGDMSFMFEKAEAEAELKEEIKEIHNEAFMPKKKSEEEMRAKRSAIFDKIMAEKGAVKETPEKENEVKGASAKTTREPEKTNFREMSLFDKSRDKGVRFGMKPAEKKELDLGFTEITKEDIKEANKNVKKPIIGAHRKK